MARDDKSTKRSEDFRTLKRVLSFLKSYKKQIVVICICIITSTLINFFQPLIIQRITDLGMVEKNLSVIIQSVCILLALVVAGQLLEVLQAHLFADIHNSVHFNLFARGFRKLLNLKLSYFSDKNSAEVIENMKTDVSSVSSITDQTFAITISFIFKVLSGLAGLLVISWKLTIVVVLLVPIKYIIVNLLAKMTEKLTESQIENFSSFASWFSDNINGVKEIKLWGLHHNRWRTFEKKQKDILSTSKKQTILFTWNTFAETVLEWLMTGILYVMGGIMIIRGTLTIGGVFAFISYSGYVTGPIMAILNLRFMISNILPSARRLFQFFDLEEEEDSQDSSEIDDQAEIEYKNVSFCYDTEKEVLNNVNLKIIPGEKIAIIGSNGSGKTTFLNLLLRFLQPQSGCITIGGKDIWEANLVEYRKKFAVVSQDPYLFFDTVKNNINLDGNASDAVFETACRKSGAAAFIANMRDKENSRIGRNGSRLSGGEKKKLAVARAIIKDTQFVILDEATAEFDVESDAYLQDFLTKELKGKTLIMITHRYHQLNGMDRVYRIEDGTLIEVDMSKRHPGNR